MAEGLANYSYAQDSPLPDDGKCIRLMHIERGDSDSPIRVRLQRHSLDEPDLQYNALSYVWGDESNKKQIICDGTALSITSNLHAALHQLRELSCGRIGLDQASVIFHFVRSDISPIWVDAICIDQENIKEKTAQVKRMDRIYELARRVIIWLGEEKTEREAECAFISTEILYRNQFSTIEVRPGSRKAEMVDHIRRLLDRPWFRRTWVIQEAALGRDVYLLWGSQSLPWDRLARAVNTLTFDFEFQEGVTNELLEVWDRNVNSITAIRLHRDGIGGIGGIEREQITTLNLLLQTARENHVKDPRDKVFALLGIATQKGGLEADYSKDVREVYTDTARTLIRETSSLETLSLTDASHHGADLPSWVPDWRIPFTLHTISWGESRPRSYCASGSRGIRFVEGDDKSKLILEGFPIDEVDKAVIRGPFKQEELLRAVSISNFKLDENTEGDGLHNIFSALAERHGLSGMHTPTSEPMHLALMRTICLDLLPGSGRTNEVLQKRYFPWYAQRYGLVEALTHTDEIVLLFRAMGEIMSRSRRVLTKRCLGFTANGYLAVFPAAAEKGDRVYIVSGADAPLVVRHLGTEYEYIGECYVHGIMDGEAVHECSGTKPPWERMILV